MSKLIKVFQGLALTLALTMLFGVFMAKDANAATVPMLKDVQQLSANQLKVTYDQQVDGIKGVTPSNYWIQSLSETSPTGIATLGKKDSVKPSNSLTPSKVSIVAADATGTNFILTFNQSITKGKPYKMVICYVTTPGAPPYSGDNGSRTFTGK